MRDRNESRAGYKKTQVGWIPEEWNSSQLKDVALIQTGLAKGKNNLKNPRRLPYLRVANVQEDHLILDEIKEIEVEEKEVDRYLLKNNDVLFTEGGDFDKLGRGCIWKEELPICIHQNHIFVVRCDEVNLFPYFLRAHSSGPFGKKYFKLNSKQSTNLASINSSQLKNFPIPLPPLPEQKKIAEILSTWDEAIGETKRLIEVKKRRKKGLMQALLSGRKRVPGFGKEQNNGYRFAEDWELIPAGELFKPKSIKGHGGEPALSVTQDRGVIYRSLVEKKIETSEESTHTYKLVEPGDFVISLRSFQGGLEYSKVKGIVSPAYHVIYPGKKIDEGFYKYYFKSWDFIGHLATAVIGIRDGKQVSFNDFSFLQLPYPSVPEQKKIAAILSTADEEITLLEQKLQTLEKQKRGLSQKLLTGEIRVGEVAISG